MTDFAQHCAACKKQTHRGEPVIAIQFLILQLHQHYTYLALYCITLVCYEACRLLYPGDICYIVCRLHILKIQSKDLVV